MRRFNRPVLILWGEKDTNFGPDIAKRLARDIPGTKRLAWLPGSAHLPMLEELAVYSAIATRFLVNGAVDAMAQAALRSARK